MSPTRDNWFDKGRNFKKDGDYQNAIICFKSLLKEHPDDTATLSELYKCCLLAKRLKEGVDAVNQLMRIYVTGKKKMEALMVYGELIQAEPRHSFDQDLQVILTDWLEEVEDFQNAVAALENYAQRYPHDKKVPDLILRAAKITRHKIKDLSRTSRLVQLISDKYPDSAAAKAAKAL